MHFLPVLGQRVTAGAGQSYCVWPLPEHVQPVGFALGHPALVRISCINSALVLAEHVRGTGGFVVVVVVVGFHLQPVSLMHPAWVLCPLHKAALKV